MSVRPDDKKRGLADAQLIGCCWRKPCIRILIVGPSREHDGRFDDGRAVPGSYRAVESCEPIAVCRDPPMRRAVCPARLVNSCSMQTLPFARVTLIVFGSRWPGARISCSSPMTIGEPP